MPARVDAETQAGNHAQYCSFNRKTGILPVMPDGLPACRFHWRTGKMRCLPSQAGSLFSWREALTLLDNHARSAAWCAGMVGRACNFLAPGFSTQLPFCVLSH
jgi:hypothetical protein